MNHLNEKNSVLNRPMYLCLCPVCHGQFLDTGIYKIVRENHRQAKERCDFCNRLSASSGRMQKSSGYAAEPSSAG